MAITEIALLRLLPPTVADDAALQSKLGHAKAVMEKYTGRRFYYMQQVEDPALIYVIGEWESLNQHMNDFIPSADNQAVLESLKAELTVEWLVHIDAPHADLPLPHAATFAIARHFVKPGEEEEFKKTFEDNKHHLEEFVTEGPIGGGWRVDKEEGKEEFVLFTLWKDVDQHFSFAQTEGFKEYAKIRDFVDGAEIKHARILKL